jgi:hypothetical protein
MRHLLVFPVWLLLLLLSLLIGGIMYLWKFSSKHFRKGSSYLNKHINFMDWYEFSK